MLTNDSVWCVLPWFHHTIDNNGGMKPCCSWDGKASAGSPDWFNAEEMQRLRHDFANGRVGRGCGVCVTRESSGIRSFRQLSLAFANESGIDVGQPHRLRSLEINPSNVCNLRCRTCNGDSSSKWVADEIAMGLRSPNGMYLRQSNWELPDDGARFIRRIEFLGGEPLLHQDDIVRNLSKIGDLSNFVVDITTNGTIPMNDDLVDLFLRCEHAFVTVSVDGYGAINEYIRSDSSWEAVVSTLERLDDLAVHSTAIEYGILSVYSVLNCNTLHELWRWYETALCYTGRKASIIPLYSPEFYDVRNLPSHFKDALTHRLAAERDDHPPRTSVLLQQMIEYMNMDPYWEFDRTRREFMSFNGYIDDTRDASLADVNPDVFEIFK